jgi:hypothetical protein
MADKITTLELLEKVQRESQRMIKEIKEAKKLGKKFEGNLDKNLMLEFVVHVGLDTYKRTPETFNSFPEGDYYPDIARSMLEYFCFCINNQKEVPSELLEYFRDCFAKILKGGLTTDACLNLVGRKKRHPFLYPDYLDDVTSDILDKEYDLTKACKEAQTRGIDKEVKYLMQQFKQYSIYCLQHWFLHKRVTKKLQFNNLNTELTEKQKKALLKYFDIGVTEEGGIIALKNTPTQKSD